MKLFFIILVITVETAYSEKSIPYWKTRYTTHKPIYLENEVRAPPLTPMGPSYENKTQPAVLKKAEALTELPVEEIPLDSNSQSTIGKKDKKSETTIVNIIKPVPATVINADKEVVEKPNKEITDQQFFPKHDYEKQQNKPEPKGVIQTYSYSRARDSAQNVVAEGNKQLEVVTKKEKKIKLLVREENPFSATEIIPLVEPKTETTVEPAKVTEYEPLGTFEPNFQPADEPTTETISDIQTKPLNPLVEEPASENRKEEITTESESVTETIPVNEGEGPDKYFIPSQYIAVEPEAVYTPEKNGQPKDEQEETNGEVMKEEVITTAPIVFKPYYKTTTPSAALIPVMSTTAKPILIPPKKVIPTLPTNYDDTGEPNEICKTRFARYPVVGQCDAYIKCYNYVAEELLCPDGLLYNPEIPLHLYPCAYPKDVTCPARSQIQPAQPTAECEHQFGYFRGGDESNCGLYKSCVAGRAYEFHCPVGLAFNHRNYLCEWPELVPECNAEAYLRFTCPEVTYDSKGRSISVFFRRNRDCSTYIACVNGKPRLLSCDTGLAFNEAVERCDLIENVPECVVERKQFINRGDS